MTYSRGLLQLPMNLTHVTAFLRGAELFSSGTVEIPGGESEVVLTQVASSMNEQSLSVSASNGVTILSASVETDYLEDGVLTVTAKKLREKLNATRVERGRLAVQVKALEEQVNTLQANRQLAPEGSRVAVSVSELGAIVDFIANRAEKAWNTQIDLNVAIEKLDEEIEALGAQLEEENGKDAPAVGKVVLKLLTDKPTKTEIRLSYVTFEAGWAPAYDLRVDEIGAPVHLVYKARVFQNSGVHWEDVLLTLSTGNPSQGVQVPVLYPWYIRKEQAYDAVPMAAMMREEVAEVAAPMMMKARVAKAAPVESNTLSDHVTTNAQGLHVNFEIALPYTIPSDGKGHLVMIQDARVPAEYNYVATPKLDADAFLLAQIKDWQALNLLPGQTSVYFEGSYVGQGYIDFNQIREGMTISLGREKRIMVERVEDENNQSKAGLLGGGVQRTFSYTIHADNARPDAVKLLIRDQLPVSQDSEINVTDLKLADGRHDEKTGMLEWERMIPAGGKESIVFSYGVKYAKDLHVEGL